MTLTLGAACGGDRAVAPAAVPSVSTADLPPGTIRREFTPPEQLGLWTRADSLTAQQGVERARRQAAHVTAAQRRALLAHPRLDDYPVLRVAMTATSEADVNRVLLPALRRLVTVSSLDRSGEAAAGTPRGVRYSYRGQALLSVRFADARRMKVSVEGTPHRDALAVAGAMGRMSAETGELSLQDLALLIAGLSAMRMELADMMASTQRSLAMLGGGRQVGGWIAPIPTLPYRAAVAQSWGPTGKEVTCGGITMVRGLGRDDSCFTQHMLAVAAVVTSAREVTALEQTATSLFARAIATGSTAAAAATTLTWIGIAAVVGVAAVAVHAAYQCSTGARATSMPSPFRDRSGEVPFQRVAERPAVNPSLPVRA